MCALPEPKMVTGLGGSHRVFLPNSLLFIQYLSSLSLLSFPSLPSLALLPVRYKRVHSWMHFFRLEGLII